MQRLGDHAVPAGAAEASAAIDGNARAEVSPEPVERQPRTLAERIPQRDVERRHGHGDDAAAIVGRRCAPKVVPDGLDRGRILADDARNDRLLQRRCDGAQARPEGEEIAHADNAGLRLHFEHKETAGIPERMTLEPRRIRPRHPQERGANGRNGHVHEGAPEPNDELLRPYITLQAAADTRVHRAEAAMIPLSPPMERTWRDIREVFSRIGPAWELRATARRNQQRKSIINESVQATDRS